MIRRRRPLLRAAMIGGVGYASYQAGKRTEAQTRYQSDQDAQPAQLQQQAPAAPASAPPAAEPGPPAVPPMDRIEALTRLKGLLDSGVLTQEEFDAEKHRVLSS